jgi:hypothetical protein
MKRINKKSPIAKLLQGLASDKFKAYIGATCRFSNLDGRGTYHRDNIFEIIGTQKCYGYNEQGDYGLTDGVRVAAITQIHLSGPDTFGCAAHLEDLEIISMPN